MKKNSILLLLFITNVFFVHAQLNTRNPFDSLKINNKFKVGIEFNFPISVKDQKDVFFLTSIGIRLISLKKASTFQITYYQLNEPASTKVQPLNSFTDLNIYSINLHYKFNIIKVDKNNSGLYIGPFLNYTNANWYVNNYPQWYEYVDFYPYKETHNKLGAGVSIEFTKYWDFGLYYGMGLNILAAIDYNNIRYINHPELSTKKQQNIGVGFKNNEIKSDLSNFNPFYFEIIKLGYRFN